MSKSRSLSGFASVLSATDPVIDPAGDIEKLFGLQLDGTGALQSVADGITASFSVSAYVENLGGTA